ncbi:MAG: hypothetical protein C0618_12365 [Desulfuromonas sp.]|nr:MAG: hypothetical protein C0618_12365 [Desulfuromonas sp.]
MSKSFNVADLIHWYDQRQLRERLLLVLCCAAVVYVLWDALIATPLLAKARQGQQELLQAQTDIADLTAQKTILEARKGFDPDRENRDRLAVLTAENERVRLSLAENVADLVSPREMPELLKALLNKQKKLTLVSLENFAPEPLQISPQATDQQTLALYRHAMQMEFSGDYLATLTYLRSLDDLPRRLVWDDLEIETQTYPKATVRVTIHTLSLEKGWIGG